MGGSGGVFGRVKPDEYKERIRETLLNTRDEGYETQVSNMIDELLTDYNSRDTEWTKEQLDEIKEVLGEDIEGTIETLFGGSVKRYTYVEGLSDVDVLLLINKTELSDLSPKEVLTYISSTLEEYPPAGVKDISVGDLAVTIRYYDDTKIQLLPAIKKGDGFKISRPKENEWSDIIRPDKFASRLTDLNQKHGGKVIPAIKLAKGINSQLPENKRLTGYHIESIAIEAFKSYPESNLDTSKALLKYFYEKGKEIVKTPIRDNTGQSIHVDDHLGSENSVQRLQRSNAMERMYKRMNNADAVGSVSEWESILGE